LGNNVKLAECALESSVECVVCIFIIYMEGVDLYCTIDKRKQAYWLSGIDRCKILLFDGEILPFFCQCWYYVHLFKKKNASHYSHG